MPNGMGDRDHEITTSIQRSLRNCADLCAQLGAGYRDAFDEDTAGIYERAAQRWRQAIDGALREWVAADRRDALRALVAVEADAETLWCPTPAGEEAPRVH